MRSCGEIASESHMTLNREWTQQIGCSWDSLLQHKPATQAVIHSGVLKLIKKKRYFMPSFMQTGWVQAKFSIDSTNWKHIGRAMLQNTNGRELQQAVIEIYNNNNNNMIVLSSCQVITGIHSDHTTMQCTEPGGRRLDGDSLGHTHIKSPNKCLREALCHHHHLILLRNLKAGTYFAVPRRVAGWVDPNTASKDAATHAQSRRPQWVWPAGACHGGAANLGLLRDICNRPKSAP